MTNQAVNLLPWRERQDRRRQVAYFLVLAMSVILPCLGALLLHSETGREVERLRSEISGYRLANDRTELIKEQQARLTSKIDQAENWLAEYEVLLARRMLFLRLWSELAQHLPDSMHYQSLELERSSLILTGVTNSSPDLATYMRRLEASSVFVSPRLIELEDSLAGHQFGIEASLALDVEAASRGEYALARY